MKPATIQDVSDTALWVAIYRAEESSRRDALFRDPFAERLAGARGLELARRMRGSKYTAWVLAIRTLIIDRMISSEIAAGAGVVVNLGAGLDTRPYRMELPADLHWIEVDFPHLIQHKEDCLKGEPPRCRLERVSADLSDPAQRQQLIRRLGGRFSRVLVITEGVLPYLPNEEVLSLATELRREGSLQGWIVDYYAPRVLRFMRSRAMRRRLRNAPFRFEPGDWFGFLERCGWIREELVYLGEESLRLRRALPMPWWARLFGPFFSRRTREEFLRYLGIALLRPRP